MKKDIVGTDKSINDQLNDNIDRPDRHSIGGSMNRPTRNEDPLSPRNLVHDSMPVEDAPIGVTRFQLDVKSVLNGIEDMLIEKNTKYGNSALDPQRVFSKADSVEQIKVRIDDKLSRIANQNENDDEDAIKDLMGYLVLLTIANDKM